MSHDRVVVLSHLFRQEVNVRWLRVDLIICHQLRPQHRSHGGLKQSLEFWVSHLRPGRAGFIYTSRERAEGAGGQITSDLLRAMLQMLHKPSERYSSFPHVEPTHKSVPTAETDGQEGELQLLEVSKTSLQAQQHLCV